VRQAAAQQRGEDAAVAFQLLDEGVERRGERLVGRVGGHFEAEA
jgi:hypothetical protein